jgi:hypothetical protein
VNFFFDSDWLTSGVETCPDFFAGSEAAGAGAGLGSLGHNGQGQVFPRYRATPVECSKVELILNRRKQIGGVAVDGERAQLAQRLFISSAANESDGVEAGFVRSFEVEASVAYSDGFFR